MTYDAERYFKYKGTMRQIMKCKFIEQGMSYEEAHAKAYERIQPKPKKRKHAKKQKVIHKN